MSAPPTILSIGAMSGKVTLTSAPSAIAMSGGKVMIRLQAKLNGGVFHITLRLEDRASPSEFFPIDKQVGALSFSVQRKLDDRFMGLTDMDVAITEQQPS